MIPKAINTLAIPPISCVRRKRAKSGLPTVPRPAVYSPHGKQRRVLILTESDHCFGCPDCPAKQTAPNQNFELPIVLKATQAMANDNGPMPQNYNLDF